MCDIDLIMYLIDERRSKYEQDRGIAMAQNIKCLKAFFQPFSSQYSKSVWHNCALIICKHTDNELNPYLIDMLLWLQDSNWPGADTILHRLREFQDVKLLSVLINSMVPALVAIDEHSWLESIATLLENRHLCQAIDQNTLKLLEQIIELHISN